MDCGSCQCRSGIGAFSISIALGFEAVYAGTQMVPPGENSFSVRIVVTVIVTPLKTKGECLLFPKADIQITKNRVKLGAAFGQKRTCGSSKASVSIILLLVPSAVRQAQFAYQ